LQTWLRNGNALLKCGNKLEGNGMKQFVEGRSNLWSNGGRPGGVLERERERERERDNTCNEIIVRNS